MGRKFKWNRETREVEEIVEDEPSGHMFMPRKGFRLPKATGRDNSIQWSNQQIQELWKSDFENQRQNWESIEHNVPFLEYPWSFTLWCGPERLVCFG